MNIYPKRDIKNTFGKVIWFKSKVYECTPFESEMHPWMYVVTCELYGNEYPVMTWHEIELDFYTVEDHRDMKISSILK